MENDGVEQEQTYILHPMKNFNVYDGTQTAQNSPDNFSPSSQDNLHNSDAVIGEWEIAIYKQRRY